MDTIEIQAKLKNLTALPAGIYGSNSVNADLVTKADKFIRDVLVASKFTILDVISSDGVLVYFKLIENSKDIYTVGIGEYDVFLAKEKTDPSEFYHEFESIKMAAKEIPALLKIA